MYSYKYNLRLKRFCLNKPKWHEALQTSNITNFVPQTLSNKVGTKYDIKENTFREYTLTIDKLILNLIPSDSGLGYEFNYSTIRDDYPQEHGYYIINHEVSLKKNKRNEKNFLHLFNIYVSGVHVGELSTDSRIFNGSELVKLTFDNRVFYESEWYKYYLTIITALELKLHNISYLEIAYDSYDLFKPYKNLYLNSTICDRNNYRQVEKIKVQALDSNAEYVVGGKHSDKKVAIYPKSQEAEENGKDYIPVYHRLNGLDTSRQIDRVELRIKNSYLKKYSITLEDLTTQAGLEAIFKLFTEDSLSFNDLNTKFYDANRNKHYKRIDLVDFSSFTGKEFAKVQPQATVEESNRGIKMHYRQLVNKYLSTGEQQYYDAVESFISSPAYYLTSTPYESYFGSMDLEGTNKTAYKELTERIVKDFDHAPTPETLERLDTLVDRLFYNFDPNEVFVFDESMDMPF